MQAQEYCRKPQKARRLFAGTEEADVREDVVALEVEVDETL